MSATQERLDRIGSEVGSVRGPFRPVRGWTHTVPPQVLRDFRDMHTSLAAVLTEVEAWEKLAERARELDAAGTGNTEKIREAIAKGEVAAKMRELIAWGMSESGDR